MVLKKVLLLNLFISFLVIINNLHVQAQNSPIITYATPQNYTVGSTMSPLSPTNSGGSASPANYSAPAIFASYNTPFSIAIDASNNVYTTNNSTGDVTKFNSAGTVLFTINSGDIQASEVAVDGLGNIYVSQFTANSILKYSPSGTFLGIVTGFSDPYGIAFDASNNAYIANYFSGNILKLDTGMNKSVYLTGFNNPYGITIDNSGNMYVSEQGVGDIIKVAAGTLTRTTFASGFNNPRHLSKDNSGNIYVADYGNNAIQMISPAGTVTPVLSTGLSFPRQAVLDSSGSLYVANYGTNALLKALPAIYPTSYAISAPLPAGLNFNTSTGQITGTPTAAAAVTTYTITATYNTGAVSSAPLTITVGLHNNATLANLALSSGSLSPEFASGTGSYTANVANNVNSITVTPTTSDSTATVTVNGTTVPYATASASQPLNVGSNTITATVTAPDGVTVQSYTVTVIRSSSSNASLSNLALSSGSLSPAFSSGITSYTANVINNVNSITVTPTTSDPLATVTINGTIVASGTASASLPLNVGNNTITTVVTAQDGTTTQSYTVTVNMGASNTTLTNLVLSSGNLSPAFSSATGSYMANVPNNISSITLTPTASDPTTTIMVNGLVVTSGSVSVSQPLNIGNNTITTTVTGQAGTTPQLYTVNVIRAGVSNAALANLALSNGSLSPVFTSGTASYTAKVLNSISSITVMPTTSDPTATVTVNGTVVASGTASSGIPLNAGNNTITTLVIAQDGITTQQYTVMVNRAPSSNATLASLSLSNGSLSPVFSSGIKSYTVNVTNNIGSIAVTPIASDSTAIVTVNGTPVAYTTTSANLPLNVGNNAITTVVTAQDGTTTQSYMLTVTRPPSSNAGIDSLSLSSGNSNTPFSSGTGSYTVTVANNVNSITLKPTTSNATATVTVNGIIIANGASTAPIALKVGSNTITTIVTAQNKTTKNTYTVTIIRAPSSNAGLANLTLSSGKLNPAFATGTAVYAVSVSNSITSLTVTPITSDATATVTVNGTTLTSGTASAPIALALGNNTITTIVTAQDGKTKQTYTVTVNRPLSSNAGLSNLAVGSGQLSPAFAPGITNYKTTVINTVSSIQIRPTLSDKTATLTVNGVKFISGTISAPIALAMGNNMITIVVTAQDGTTQNTYTLIVSRDPKLLDLALLASTQHTAPTNLSANATLADLTTDIGALTPIFNPDTLNYNVSADNTTSTVAVTPVIKDAGATLTINGTMLTNGSSSGPISLNTGNNVITTVVTAQDGTTKRSYTINVDRLKPGLSVDANMQNGADKILVHQAVSPNGDGINDFLLIEGIERYPGNRVTLFNSNGVTIYNAIGYDNSSKVFDGHSNINGRLQQPGTYFYTIEYTLNGELRRKTGYFILKF